MQVGKKKERREAQGKRLMEEPLPEILLRQPLPTQSKSPTVKCYITAKKNHRWTLFFRDEAWCGVSSSEEMPLLQRSFGAKCLESRSSPPWRGWLLPRAVAATQSGESLLKIQNFHAPEPRGMSHVALKCCRHIAGSKCHLPLSCIIAGVEQFRLGVESWHLVLLSSRCRWSSTLPRRRSPLLPR